MEESVPGTSSTTASTERDLGNAVDTGASGAERRSRRRKAPLRTQNGSVNLVEEGCSSPWSSRPRVVRDSRLSMLITQEPTAVLLPFGQRLAESPTLHVHTEGPSTALTAAVTEVVRQRDPALAIYGVTKALFK